jgi:hypothetical protein
MQHLKAHVIRELAAGRAIEFIFDNLEESYGALIWRADMKRRRRSHRKRNLQRLGTPR